MKTAKLFVGVLLVLYYRVVCVAKSEPLNGHPRIPRPTSVDGGTIPIPVWLRKR